MFLEQLLHVVLVHCILLSVNWLAQREHEVFRARKSRYHMQPIQTSKEKHFTTLRITDECLYGKNRQSSSPAVQQHVMEKVHNR